jgi:hypothetical protein
MIAYERDGSAEFSDLYVRLLSAALDQSNSSLSPQMRDRHLVAHVARGISMTGLVPDSLLQSAGDRVAARSTHPDEN